MPPMLPVGLGRHLPLAQGIREPLLLESSVLFDEERVVESQKAFFYADGEGVALILPKVRDRRFITIRRGGTLTDSDHQLLALWAATCAEQVLPLDESVQASDGRPRQAIALTRQWARREITWWQARTAAGHADAAARISRVPLGMLRTPPVRRLPSGMRPHTNSVLLPMR